MTEDMLAWLKDGLGGLIIDGMDTCMHAYETHDRCSFLQKVTQQHLRNGSAAETRLGSSSTSWTQRLLTYSTQLVVLWLLADSSRILFLHGARRNVRSCSSLS